jgi:hypothetical protein
MLFPVFSLKNGWRSVDPPLRFAKHTQYALFFSVANKGRIAVSQLATLAFVAHQV